MQEVWYRGHKDREERKKRVKAYSTAFSELSEVLDKYYRKPNCTDYDNPQWVHKQIAANEYNRALDDLIKLINLKD